MNFPGKATSGAMPPTGQPLQSSLGTYLQRYLFFQFATGLRFANMSPVVRNYWQGVYRQESF